MPRKHLLLLAVALVIGAVAIVRIVRTVRSHRNADFPEGTFWVCLDCGREFNLTIRQLGAWYDEHPGQPVPCPDCGGRRTARAARCPNCGRYVPRDKIRGQQPPVCPYCHRRWPVIAPRQP